VKEKDGDTYQVSVNASLAFTNYTIQTEIWLDYAKTNGKWVVGKTTYDVMTVTPKSDPVLNDAMNTVVNKIKEDGAMTWFNDLFHDTGIFEVESTIRDSDPSKVVLILKAILNDGPRNQSAQITVECQFNRFVGWVYTMKDWTNTETMNWTGTYDLVFTVDEPGYPSNYLNQFFDVGDEIKGMTIQGSVTLVRKMDGTRVETNETEVNFTFKGIDYKLAPKTFGQPERLWIKLDKNPDYTSHNDMEITLSYFEVPLAQPGDNKYHLESFCMIGEVIKRP
jgi:hypothetical protein